MFIRMNVFKIKWRVISKSIVFFYLYFRLFFLFHSTPMRNQSLIQTQQG